MSLTDKLKTVVDAIDPQIDGIVILIVGGVQYGPYGITSSGNDQFDAERLATALRQAVLDKETNE
jgi:hypothetical protein